jgi:hypothetical protein
MGSEARATSLEGLRLSGEPLLTRLTERVLILPL